MKLLVNVAIARTFVEDGSGFFSILRRLLIHPLDFPRDWTPPASIALLTNTTAAHLPSTVRSCNNDDRRSLKLFTSAASSVLRFVGSAEARKMSLHFQIEPVSDAAIRGSCCGWAVEILNVIVLSVEIDCSFCRCSAAVISSSLGLRQRFSHMQVFCRPKKLWNISRRRRASTSAEHFRIKSDLGVRHFRRSFVPSFILPQNCREKVLMRTRSWI